MSSNTRSSVQPARWAHEHRTGGATTGSPQSMKHRCIDARQRPSASATAEYINTQCLYNLTIVATRAVCCRFPPHGTATLPTTSLLIYSSDHHSRWLHALCVITRWNNQYATGSRRQSNRRPLPAAAWRQWPLRIHQRHHTDTRALGHTKTRSTIK